MTWLLLVGFIFALPTIAQATDSQIDALLKETASRNLPVELLQNKLQEGSAKKLPNARILGVLQNMRGHIDRAATLFSEFFWQPLRELVLYAPHAKSVAVAGTFNHWNAQKNPLNDSDGDGVWTAQIALDAGRYEYMFIVDDTTWVTDRTAKNFQPDGFGHNNAVLEL